MALSPGDWEALTKLAGRVNLPTERVGLLRRLENADPRPGAPYTLFVGRPGAGIELLLARWISPEAAEALQRAGDRPLVLGPTPHEVKPRIGVWPTFSWPTFQPGHLWALRLIGRPAADLVAQIASLGGVEEVVWVTRLSQALNQAERDAGGAFRTLAATARVLIVGLAGEEATGSELAEVSAFTAAQMGQLGFRNGRCLGAGVWFAGDGKRPGAVDDLFAFLSQNDAETTAGRVAMVRQAVADLFSEVGRRAKENAPPPPTPVDEKERDRLTRELCGYLADLGRELNAQVESGRPQTSEKLRRYALDALRGWGAYTTIEGHWMKYVDHLRPGVQAAFLTETESALACLEYDPPAATKAAHTAPPSPPSPLVERVIVEAKRGAVGLVCGITAYVAVASFLAPPASNLPFVVESLLSYLALAVGMVLGYAVGRGFFRLPLAAPTESGAAPGAPRIHGWLQVERRLTAWFVEQINVKPVSPADECRLLARRLGVEEETQ